MPHNPGRWLVETDWLADHLSSPDIVVLDGSLTYEPGRSARESFEDAHIPGALFFDIGTIADTNNPLPNTLADPVKFSSMMRKMGVGDGTKVIVYDAQGLFSAARVWWNFRAMGHDDVAVLNGGLKKWRAEGRALEDGPAAVRTPKHFTARRQAALICDADDVAAALAAGTATVIDARSAGRFAGAVPEDRAGLRAGHIPGSVNLHYGALTNDDGTLKPADELRALFAERGVTVPQSSSPGQRRPVITTCGSGVTACAVVLALALAGDPTGAVYDGSWTEWGADHARPIATG
ncbi:MAG: 3-mercaptopyruvate sulfurtransferase [Pseudomonadota bacterium]